MRSDGKLRLFAFAMLALAVVFITGCERSVPRTDYMPLRDGNRWEYRLLDMPLLKRLEQGQAIVTAPLNADLKVPSANEGTAPVKAEVVDGLSPTQENSTTNNARRVALELHDAIDDLTYKALYDTAEQVWSKRNGYIGFQSIRGRNYLMILPPHTGYKWVVTGPGGQDLFYEIESASATVSTPAGTFHGCAIARQETRNRQEIFRYWFAPNVGLVRRSKFFANEEVFRQELVEYTVKPATPGTRMAELREVRKAVEGKNHGSEFREKALDDKGRRLESVEAPDPAPIDERVKKFSAPK
jgi:hypothetical protein